MPAGVYLLENNNLKLVTMGQAVDGFSRVINIQPANSVPMLAPRLKAIATRLGDDATIVTCETTTGHRAPQVSIRLSA